MDSIDFDGKTTDACELVRLTTNENNHHVAVFILTAPTDDVAEPTTIAMHVFFAKKHNVHLKRAIDFVLVCIDKHYE